jgi:hypothetical protein
MVCSASRLSSAADTLSHYNDLVVVVIRRRGDKNETTTRGGSGCGSSGRSHRRRISTTSRGLIENRPHSILADAGGGGGGMGKDANVPLARGLLTVLDLT